MVDRENGAYNSISSVPSAIRIKAEGMLVRVRLVDGNRCTESVEMVVVNEQLHRRPLVDDVRLGLIRYKSWGYFDLNKPSEILGEIPRTGAARKVWLKDSAHNHDLCYSGLVPLSRFATICGVAAYDLVYPTLGPSNPLARAASEVRTSVSRSRPSSLCQLYHTAFGISGAVWEMYNRTKMDDQFTEWHSVRPWHPTLSLAVREITSVSVTFLLSCPYSAADSSNQDPASLGLSSSDDDDQSRESVTTTPSINTQVVADILAKGLSVKVNGTPWQRVFLKMDDVFDEGIIILYGLMPARQYDIELGLSPGQASTSVRGQITTGTCHHLL